MTTAVAGGDLGDRIDYIHAIGDFAEYGIAPALHRLAGKIPFGGIDEMGSMRLIDGEGAEKRITAGDVFLTSSE